MMNPFKDVDWSPGLVEKRKFAKSLMIGFPALAIVFSLIHWLGAHSLKTSFLYLGVIGATAGVILWVIPSIAKPFYMAWYFIACCIGFVMGNLLFCAFYFAVFTPIGLLKRSMGRPTFHKGFDKKTNSYWKEAEKEVEIGRYYRQF